MVDVVQYPISTSNHNIWKQAFGVEALYSIQFLHQITTFDPRMTYNNCCIVSNFYIKSQPDSVRRCGFYCCIVSNFYIKSQPLFGYAKPHPVVQYPISTSNHNGVFAWYWNRCVVQYPISTSNHNASVLSITGRMVVQYPISTSNHNSRRQLRLIRRLYSIQFLHQITTW